MTDPDAVADHYGSESLTQRVSQALEAAGLGDGAISWVDLTALDQFHSGGLAATQRLAEALAPAAGARVLDVGCGIGGPARFLAALYGCTVIGIDLNQPFVDVATMLSARTGLHDQTAFQTGNALRLPFADATFDAVWSQHVAMNISDRAGLYAEMHRVLRPDGRLALHDVLQGDGGPVVYPVPWADDPVISHLLTADAMRDALDTAGFTITVWDDVTEAISDRALRTHDLPQPRRESPDLGIHVIRTDDFEIPSGNLRRNLIEGRVRSVQIVAEPR